MRLPARQCANMSRSWAMLCSQYYLPPRRLEQVQSSTFLELTVLPHWVGVGQAGGARAGAPAGAAQPPLRVPPADVHGGGPQLPGHAAAPARPRPGADARHRHRAHGGQSLMAKTTLSYTYLPLAAGADVIVRPFLPSLPTRHGLDCRADDLHVASVGTPSYCVLASAM